MRTETEKPLIDADFLLEKYPGKGGWTYVVLPAKMKSSNASFRWTRVKGSIDGFEISKYNLMPMSNGNLFLPVRAEIRKKIHKESGDTVHVILFPDLLPMDLPDELQACLQLDEEANNFFQKLTEGQKQAYVKWIYSAKKEETKVERINTTIDRLRKGQKYI